MASNPILDEIIRQSQESQANLRPVPVFQGTPPPAPPPPPMAQLPLGAPGVPGAAPNPILAALGFMGEKALGALDMASNTTQTVIGDLGTAFYGGTGGREGFREGRDRRTRRMGAAARDPGSDPFMSGLMRADPFMSLLMSIPGVGDELAETAGNVGSELLTDPLNYVGMGIPVRLIKLAQSANMSPAVIKTLEGLARTEKLTQQGLELPFKAAGKAATLPLKTPGSSFGAQVIDEASGTARPSRNLYDYFTNRSRESFGRLTGRKMVDARKYLHEVHKVDLQETYALNRRKDTTYKDVFRSGDELARTEEGLIDLAGQVGDVRAQVAGLDAIAYGHKLVADQWDQLAVQFKAAKDGGMARDDLIALGQTLDEQGFDQSMRVWFAVQDQITNTARQARTLMGDVDPTVIGPVQHGVKSAQDYLRAQSQRLPTVYNESAIGPTQMDPYHMLQTMQTRATRFPRDIGNLTGRLRQQIEGSNTVPFMDLNESVRGVDTRMQMAANQTALQPGFLSLLPAELRQGMDVEWRNFDSKYRRLVTARGALERAVGEAWQNRMGATPMPAIDQNRPLESISRILETAGVISAPLKSTADLFTNRSFLGSVNSRAILSAERAVKEFPAGDILQGDPFELVIDRVIREMMETLGVKDRGAIGKVLGDVTDFYKSQALLSGSYPATNAIGGLFMGALKGVNPMRVLRGAQENVGRAWRGEQVETNSARNFREIYGESLSEATRQSSGLLETNSSRSFAQRGIPILERLGPLKLGAGGAVVGGISGAISSPADADPWERAGNMARGAAEFGAAGAAMPWVSRQVLQRLGGGLETVMRETAAAQAATQYMHQHSDELVQIAQNALNVSRPGLIPSRSGMTARVTSVGPSSGNVANALNEIQTRAANGAQMSGDELFDILTDAGVVVPQAREAANQWRAVVHRGVEEGTGFAKLIHFDYQDLSNIEQFMKAVLPFSTWAAKAIPFFVEEMAQHPIILQAFLDINEESQKAVKEAGVTQRFTGALPGQWAEGLFSAIIGRGVTPWFDPIKGLLPFSGAARQFGAGNEDDPLAAQVLNKAGAFGPGLHPLLEAGMRVATPDLLGSDEPAGSYLRWGRPIQAIDAALGGNRGRGIDANVAIQSGETLLRRGAGQDPTNLSTAAAARRIDEMALEATGQNIRSGDVSVGPYLTAKTQQRGPLWDQAMRDVQREKGTQSLIGFGLGAASPQAILGDTEATIRESRTGLFVSPELSGTLRKLNEQSPEALAPPELVDAVRTAAQRMSDQATGGQMPKQAEMILNGVPTIQNLQFITNQITQMQQSIQPEMGAYQGGGTPTEQRLTALLSAYNNVGTQTEGMPESDAKSIANLAEVYKHPVLKAQGAKGIAAVQLGKLNQQKLAYRKANPLLDQYLNYLGLAGAKGTPEDFLAHYYGKQAIPPSE